MGKIIAIANKKGGGGKPQALCFKASSRIGEEYRMFAAEVERRMENEQV